MTKFHHLMPRTRGGSLPPATLLVLVVVLAMLAIGPAVVQAVAGEASSPGLAGIRATCRALRSPGRARSRAGSRPR